MSVRAFMLAIAGTLFSVTTTRADPCAPCDARVVTNSKREVDIFAERLDKTLKEWRKKIATAQAKAEASTQGGSCTGAPEANPSAEADAEALR